MGRKQQQQLQLQQQQRRHRRQFKLSLDEKTRNDGNDNDIKDMESLYVSWLSERIEENRLELTSLATKRRQQRLDHSHSMERWKKRHAIAQSRFVGYHSHQIPVRAWQPYLYVLERLEEQEQQAEAEAAELQRQQEEAEELKQQQLRDEEEEEDEYFYVDKEVEEQQVDEEEDLVTVQEVQGKKARRRSSSLETDIDASCSFDPYVVTASFERNNRNNAVLRRHQAQLAYWLHRIHTETSLLERVKNQCSHRIVAMHSFQQHTTNVVLQPRIHQLVRETNQTQAAMEQLQQECITRMQHQLQSLLDMKQQLRQAFSNQQLLFQQQQQQQQHDSSDNQGYFIQPPRQQQQQQRRSSGLFGFNW